MCGCTTACTAQEGTEEKYDDFVELLIRSDDEFTNEQVVFQALRYNISLEVFFSLSSSLNHRESNTTTCPFNPIMRIVFIGIFHETNGGLDVVAIMKMIEFFCRKNSHKKKQFFLQQKSRSKTIDEY